MDGSERLRIIALGALLAVCLVATVAYHFVLRTGIIVGHLYYLPIAAACIWWGRRGIAVAVFSAAILVLSGHFAALTAVADSIARGCTFIVVATIIASLSESRVRAAREVRAQRDLAVELGAATTIGAALGLCLDAAIEASGMDGGGVYIVDTDTSEVRLVASRGLSPAFVRAASRYEPDSPSARLIAEGEPVFADYAELGIPLAEAQRTEGLRAVAIVPVLHEGNVIACLNVTSRTLEKTPSPARHALATIVAQIGAALSRIRAEEELRDSELRFREVADLLPDMLCETDADLNVTYANQAVMSALGYGLEDIDAGISIPRLLSPDEAEECAAHLQEVARTGATLVDEYDIMAKDGSLVPCEVSSAPVCAADASLLGYRCVMRDITQRRQAENSQRLAAVGGLATGVAHEFNNILAIMRSRAQLAEDLDTPQSQRDLIASVIRATARGARISRDLTSFARPQEPSRAPMLIERAIDGALAMIQRDFASADIAVSCTYDSQDQTVHGDMIQAEQVFLNLFMNACHAMPDGGTLTVGVKYAAQENDPGQIIITVADTGTGIASDDLHRIFEPFFTTRRQADDEEARGTGLGLSVSYGIIKAHGGTIQASSEVGVGTTFEIRLPAHGDRFAVMAQPEKAEAPEPPRPEAVGGSLLLVDDEQEFGDIMGATLTASGYEVTTAGGTAKALEALDAASFDVILCDLMMAGGGGREVIAAAQRLPDPPRVVIMSGRAGEQIAQGVLEQGASAFLLKPFDLAELLAALQGGGDAGS